MKRNKMAVGVTEGGLAKAIILYAIPLALGIIVQNLFSAVDIAVLGQMADTTAVAAVGATSAISGLIISIFVGMSTGTKIIMSRQIGKGDSAALQNTIYTSLLTAAAFGICIAVAGFFLAPLLLKWTNCPTDCLAEAILYVRIYLTGAPFILLYNYGSAILTSAGDSRRPLGYIVAGGLLNIGLNVLLCLLLDQKVIAVALATVASQVLSTILVLYRLCKTNEIYRIRLKEIRWHTYSFIQILRRGLPLGLLNALYPIGNIQLQTAVNAYGVAAVAGAGAAGSLIHISACLDTAFSNTTTVFMGQSIGAGNPERVKRSFRLSMLFGILGTIVFGTLVIVTSRLSLGFLLGGDEEAIYYAQIKVFWISGSYFLCIAYNVFASAIQAYGNTVFSSVASVFGILGVRMAWIYLVHPMAPSFSVLMMGYCASWIVSTLLNGAGYWYYTRRYRKGIYIKI